MLTHQKRLNKMIFKYTAVSYLLRFVFALKIIFKIITSKDMHCLLYILTSIVLRTPNAVSHHTMCFSRKKLGFWGIKQSTSSVLVQTLKKVFFAKFCFKFLAFFFAFLHKKCWKWLFRLTFWVCSTQTLVEIYNNCLFFKYLLQTVLAVWTFVTVISPTLLPQMEFGLCSFPVNFVAPGIMTQS